MARINSASFHVSPTSGVPIYRQLMGQIEQLILCGQLAVNETLPSVRDLAAQVEVNPMTVSKAYSLMESAGWLARRRGKGMVVAPIERLPQRPGDAAAVLRPAIVELVERARQLGISRRQILEYMGRVMEEES